MVIPDNAQKRALYEEQVIRTFFISHADATELAQILNGIIRIPGARGGAADRREQDEQHDHGARQRQHRRDHRADHRAERQPAGGNRHRRADPRGQPDARQAVRPRPRQIYTINARVLARDRPARHRRTPTRRVPQPFNLNTITRGISTADFYLSVPSAVVRFLETDSRDAADRQAAAARRGRAGDHAQPRRRDSGAVDRVHADRAGRRELQPADVVQLPAGRRQHRDDAARHVRGRHHPRPARREQHARPGHQRRRPEPAVVRLPEGADAAAAARRRVEPARRPAARGRAEVAARHSRDSCGCRSSQPVRGERHRDHADRHRHAADAADRADAGADAARMSARSSSARSRASASAGRRRSSRAPAADAAAGAAGAAPRRAPAPPPAARA